MTASHQPELSGGLRRGAAQSGAATVIPPAPQRLPAPSGSPEAVAAQAAQTHPRHAGIAKIAQRLSKGLNTRSGSSLADVQELARLLYIELADNANAMAVCQLITELPYDRNHGRWTAIESCLALAVQMAQEQGEHQLAADYAHKLRAPDRESIDDFRDKMNARVRQRSLNEPNLYDREIAKAASAVDKRAELQWRNLRVQTLLFLAAHGGSETYRDDELARLTNNELLAIRALVAGSRS